MDIGVAHLGNMTHSTNLDQQINAEADTDEEHNHLDHLVLERTYSGQGDRLPGRDTLAIKNLVYHPQHT